MNKAKLILACCITLTNLVFLAQSQKRQINHEVESIKKKPRIEANKKAELRNFLSCLEETNNNLEKETQDLDRLKSSVDNISHNIESKRAVIASLMQKLGIEIEIDCSIPADIPASLVIEDPEKQQDEEITFISGYKETDDIKKRFKCSLCEYRSETKQRLKYHVNVHNGQKPYKCTFENCAKAYASKPALGLHIKAKHTGSLHPCPTPGCFIKFTTPSGLHRHIKKKHEKNEDES